MPDFADAEIDSLTLSVPEREEFTHLISRFGAVNPKTSTEQYVSSAQLLSGNLPERLRAALLRLRANGSRQGGLLIRRVPIGRVPATPSHADLAVGLGLDAAKATSLVAGILGEQYGFEPELSGQIIQDIIPVHGFEDTQQSISSRALLELHCETAFTDTRADFVGLLCLRADVEHQAATLISPAIEVLSLLSAETVSVLRQPRFATTIDGSFLRGSGLTGPLTVQPITVLAGTADHPRLRADFAETTGLGSRARQAVAELYDAALAAARAVYLEPGDLLIVDNHSAFHGRTSFAIRKDGTDRWLLRTFVLRDLARTINHRPAGGRIVSIDYRNIAHTSSNIESKGLQNAHENA